jgi:hypothetical protein
MYKSKFVENNGWESLVQELSKYSKAEYVSIDSNIIPAKIARLKKL